ncbi:MAG: ABC transporter permease [archaeon GB-1867-035]|nr:ABC transporter permease [Candidatus Culexmicrobium profundum]
MALKYYYFKLLIRYYWIQWILPFEFLNLFFMFLSWYYFGLAAGANQSIFTKYGGFTNFLLVGLIVNTVLKSSLNSFINATNFMIKGKVGGKTGQAMSFYDYCIIMGIPISAPILACIVDEYSEGLIFAFIYLIIGLLFNFTYPSSGILISLLAIILGSLALIGFSLIASAITIHFNTWRGGINPLIWLLNTISTVFSGVYFPLEIIPENLRAISLILPQTYTIRIIRYSALGESALQNVIYDLTILLLLILILLPLGAMLYLRELGSLRKHPPII